MQWWCVARGETWNWIWKPYPGVWIFVAVFAAAYFLLVRNTGGENARIIEQSNTRSTEHVRRDRWRRIPAIVGISLLWITLDWPVGALGAGYLASVHSLQYVMLSMVVPAFLLFGMGDAALYRLRNSPKTVALVSAITAPAFAAFFFTLVMGATHASPLLDSLMRSQLGSFLLDMLWLTSGILLAWPLIIKVPERPRFGPPVQILYVFLGTVAHVFVGMWFLSSQFPVYATYELAPRVGNITAMTDQHLAGAVILMLGTPIVLGAVTWIFFRWQGTGAEPLDAQGISG